MADLTRLPANLGAERAILASILLDNSLLNTVLEKVTEEDFYYPKNRTLFSAMLTLTKQQDPIDFQTLTAELGRQKVLEEMGGPAVILELTAEPYYTANLDSYIQLVLNTSLQRALVRYGDQVQNQALDGEDSGIQVLERAEKDLIRLGERQSKGGLTQLKLSLQEALERMDAMARSGGGLTGLPTGFRALDASLSGFQKSDLILLAARPSMGKTALGLNLAFNVAKFRKKKEDPPKQVAIFSLEMSKLQLSQRFLSMASGVDLAKIIGGDIQNEEWDLVLNGAQALQQMHIYMDDTSPITVQELRSKCRRMKMEHGLDLIVIDYLQLMAAGSGSRNENRQQEISEISRGLKALAKELDCPVLALSQLSRKTESREGSRPLMSDMRESGAIEQDADVVMLLYRRDYYEKNVERPHVAEVIIAKHRNGPTGTVELYFEDTLTRFKDVDHGPDTSGEPPAFS